MEKIAVFTGGRSEYGLLRPLLALMKADKDIQMCLIVSGSHLSDKFGRTVELVKEDGFEVSFAVESIQKIDDRLHLAKATANAMAGIADYLWKTKPDCIVLLGDRSECFAAASAALIVGVPIAHIHGGDIAGAGLDEYFRHAITKMAAIHFPATLNSQKRLIMMGERPGTVFHVGSLGFEQAKKIASKPADRSVLKKYGLDGAGPFAVVVFHSISTSPASAGKELGMVLEAIIRTGIFALIISPNSDPGHEQIIGGISAFISEEKSREKIRFLPNVCQTDYFEILRQASVLVGNSSSGMIESGGLGVPCVNIGTRQKDRERGGNVLDAQCNVRDILEKIRLATSREFRQRIVHLQNPYDCGNTAEKMYKILKRTDFSRLPSPKPFYSKDDVRA